MLDIKPLEGQVITAIITVLNPRIAEQLKLHKVEQYGVWRESQNYTNKVLSRSGLLARHEPSYFSYRGLEW